MEKIDFAMKKYAHIFDLFKFDLELLKKRDQIFTAIHGALLYVFYYSMKDALLFLSLIIAAISFCLAFFWYNLSRRSLLFCELRRQQMREVEAELQLEGFNLDIFEIDKKVFKPGASDGYVWNYNKEEKFPPENLRKDYKKSRSPASKYEKLIPILFQFAWPILFLYVFLFKYKFIDKVTDSISFTTLIPINRYDFITISGLSLNFVGALMIALFSEHGTSTLWRFKKLKLMGYIIFILGFGFQIISYVLKYL